MEGLSKPHVVCVPFPAQGHINPMTNFAKLLHARGFHVTFVHTDYNRARILRSQGPGALDNLPSFCFASIPDGLPLNPDDPLDATQDIVSLCASLDLNCVGHFKDLLVRLNDTAEGGPPITCILADMAMAFTLEAAEEMGIREVMLWTASACGLLGYDHFGTLIERGYTPLKDASYLTNGYLDTPIDWIPSMKGIRLKDISSFIRTTDPQDTLLNYVQSMLRRSRKAAAIAINTFDALEHDVLAALALTFPPLYAVGPLHKIVAIHDNETNTKSIPSSLWKENDKCVEWLHSQEPGSVVYVNFGSVTVMSNHHLIEFAFGLALSEKPFLWIIRPDLVKGETAVLPEEFMVGTRERGLLAEWCDQDRVLAHRSVGGFLTHSGWNSTLESISCGVPLISWPFFADQQINCWFSCNKWGIGMEIDNDVKRDVVEKQVRELMDGSQGKDIKRRALEWKKLAEEAVDKATGKSWLNLDNFISQFMLLD